MNRAKNDPGINVGDKIILRHIIKDENGVHCVDEDEKPHIVTKINSRSIYTELKTGDSGKKLAQENMAKLRFEKEGDIWIMIIDHRLFGIM